MAEIERIVTLKPGEMLPPGTRFKFATCNDRVYGSYLISGAPFSIGVDGKKWNRGIFIEQGMDEPRFLTQRDTVILPGVKVAIYDISLE